MNHERSPFYDNGLPRFKGEYLDGEMHGFWEFFLFFLTLMRSGAFDRGVQVGVWKTFDREGKLVKVTTFK